MSVTASSLVGEHEHPRDVERDVAGADHDRPLAAQVEVVVAEVGMAVVPADELGRRVAARQVLAGDPERPVGRRADRVDDRVVVAAQVLDREVAAELDVGEQAQPRVLGGALVEPRHRLDLRVVGRDAGADQAPRRRQPLEQVDVAAPARRGAAGGRRRSCRPGPEPMTAMRTAPSPPASSATCPAARGGG